MDWGSDSQWSTWYEGWREQDRDGDDQHRDGRGEEESVPATIAEGDRTPAIAETLVDDRAVALGTDDRCCKTPLGSAPATEKVACWMVSRILFREEPLVVEPGRLFFSGVPRGIGRELQVMLSPVFSHIAREDHCERAGYLHLLRSVSRRVGWTADALKDCNGRTFMYVTHFPCISCVTVISQVVRYLPAVTVEVSYDNMWKTRTEEGRRRVQPDFWKVYEVMG